VGGAVLLDLPDPVEFNLRAVARNALREKIPDGKPERRCEKVEFGTCNVVIRRHLFERIGTFDADILEGGEDTDFFMRASKHGAKMWYTPKSVVHHLIPESRLCKEYFKRTSLRGGLSSARLRYRHKGRLRLFLGLVRRIFRSCARDIWFLLIALLLGDKSRQLDRKCKLWRAIGYVRGSVTLLAPGIFGQKIFFDILNFRTRGGESETENR
jgi:GT2 family glycosyltransferase